MGGADVTSQIDLRKDFTEKRTADLQQGLRTSAYATSRQNDYCVYVTGSFGRQEACEHSDVDLFIIGGENFRRLNEICLKADIISTARKLKFPEFSGDGEYLKRYDVSELIKNIGDSEDDKSNTLTARLLLLLESRYLDGSRELYDHAIEDVVTTYWGDFDNNSDDFRPSYLANNILLFWRTLCLNYEARTKRSPDDQRAKRKLKNYKLRHSRLMTCYSALAYLLFIYAAKGTVTPQDCIRMSKMSPLERLQNIKCREESSPSRIVEAYEDFLLLTDQSEEDLVNKIMRKDAEVETAFSKQDLLGSAMFEFLQKIETTPNLLRYFLV
jgi:predicted nucleotidyltransferase